MILVVNRAMSNDLKTYFFPRYKPTEIHGTMLLFLIWLLKVLSFYLVHRVLRTQELL